jgi:NAD(P)-dependent dehydrogenase (short-subunit alcohol dehydrogenase family)
MAPRPQPSSFVTGAASGIGLALARALGARGHAVTLADRDAAALTRATEALCREGVDAHAEVLDVTDRDAVRVAIERCAARHGHLDFVFNNAGIGIGGELRDMQPEDWRRVMEVNFFGVVHGVDAAYPLMIRQGHGHIVNVASVAGLIPMPGESIYVASKHAVVGLTKSLRGEAAHYGVKVSLVCPGVVETPIYDTSPIVGFDKTKSLALWPKGISPEVCAAELLRGVDKNQAVIVVTPLARMLDRVQRLSPRLFLGITELYMGRLRKTRSS